MFFKWVIICLGFIIELVTGQVGDKCSDHNVHGVCLEVFDCSVALRSIIETGTAQLPRCGFLNSLEIICCPQTNATEGSRIADRECKKIVDQYTPPSVTKVVGGKEAAEGEFPHMVALAYPLRKSSYGFLCGGSLISNRYILTAGHCVQNVESSMPVFARLGALNISDTRFNNATDYMIENTIVHPNYKRPKSYHDLALIRLKKPVVTSDTVFPVCLYTKSRDFFTISLDITGWGVNDVAKYTTSNVLLKGQLTVVSQEICGQSYKKSRRLPESIISEQICAQDTDRKIDACQGDSGGPLQGLTENDGHYRLVGVTSLGTGCATSIPGVYTRVNKYIDWIASIVWPSD